MKKILISLVIAATFFAVGCRKQPVLNPEFIYTSNLSNKQIINIVSNAASARAWMVEEAKDNHVIAHITRRGYDYRVKITWENNKIKMNYIGDSTEKIDATYNRWINNLSSDIQKKLDAIDIQPKKASL